ncbi:hypothetical protein Dimus_037525, partial [Dionaea muscipula]
SGLTTATTPAPHPPNPFSCPATAAAAAEIVFGGSGGARFSLYLRRPPPYRAQASASSVSMDSARPYYSFSDITISISEAEWGLGRSGLHTSEWAKRRNDEKGLTLCL